MSAFFKQILSMQCHRHNDKYIKGGHDPMSPPPQYAAGWCGRMTEAFWCIFEKYQLVVKGATIFYHILFAKIYRPYRPKYTIRQSQVK